MLERGEMKSLGISIGLILVNVALMGVLAYTPVSRVLSLAFAVPLVGILVYGAMLTGGNWLAERGIKRGDTGLALLGVAVLMFAYGSFGAGLLALLGAGTQVLALAVTAIATTGIALVAGLLVYGTDHDFSSWNMYAGISFLGVLVFGGIGTVLWTPALLAAFLLALIGFMVYLVHQIWEMRSNPSRTYLNAIGIYVAYMGVFIQVLQIVLRLLEER